ncbi:MAG: hypothetical protein V1800_14075, partial [Candidatus Latescibacterota bacterium]
MRARTGWIAMVGFLACAPHLMSTGKGPPKWAEFHAHPNYAAQTHFLGVDISEVGRDQAQDAARLDVARQIRVQIQSEMVDLQRHTQIDDQEYVRTEITNRTEMLV